MSRRCPKGHPAIYLLYNAMLLAGSPLLLAALALRVARGKSVQGWSERWGRYGSRPPANTARRVWVHAASVGEVGAVEPVLAHCRRLRPDARVVMTVVTPGGYEVAEKLLGRLVDELHFAPFDAPWVVRRAVDAFRPHLFVCVETELWPNMLHAVRAAGARAALINARISDRSFPRYRRVRLLMGWALGKLDRALAQSATDADRLRALGAPPDRVSVMGNTKFDQAAEPMPAADRAALRETLRLPAGAPVWVTASTRTADEERIVVDAYARVRAARPDVVFIHAPRHVERAGEVVSAMAAAGLAPVRRTELGTVRGPVTDLVLDTFGELARVFAVADVAFIGNSLLPPGGGQNSLQALAQGVPVLYGPHVSNFRDITAMVEQAGVGWTVRDAASLAAQGLRLIGDAAERARVARLAVELVAANRGASERCAAALDALIPGSAS